MTNKNEPCLDCGACCASYRVSFYSAEADIYGIADTMVQALTPVYSCLSGTNQSKPHCQALLGEVGKVVKCSMYEQRPSPCQEVQPGDDKCQNARAKHGLVSLQVLGTVPIKKDSDKLVA
ncbi:YkgJ family cysteine cluster protein [Undibacterium sp. Ji42W]|uniref:YkgJ family cysteine cluster protein n=1 Tax=Undibacterium sp. Ji42W TaxID=3413039 RepID=UPI003BF19656